MNRKEIIAVLIAAVIMLIPFSLDLDYIPSAILWVIGGFAGALIAGKGIKNGILTGFLAAIIASIPIIVFFGSLALKPIGILFILFDIVLMSMFSIPGGLIGGLVNRRRFKTIEENRKLSSSKMKNYYGNLKSSGIITAILGLFLTLGHSSYGPLMMTFGIIFTTFAIFKNKKYNRTIYSMIIIAALTLMLTLEYFIVPIQNTIFYILLLLMSIGIFLTFYFSLKPQNHLTQREKILAWTGSALFGISLLGVMGFIFNNFVLSIIIGAFALIMIIVSLLIRRRTFKDDEFNEVYTTKKDTKEYWFKYKIGRGMPKPVRWQGWACYAIIFMSPLVIIFFNEDLTIDTIIIFAILLTVITITMLKSNYREIVREYKKI